MSTMWVCVSSAQYSFWRSNKFFFLVVCSGGLHFWRETKVSSRCYWRCLLSRQVAFQQRELRISWWLYNNFAIFLWLWKVWSLVVCPQSSFYATRTRRDDTNRQKTLLLCQKKDEIVSLKKMKLFPDCSLRFLLGTRVNPTNHSQPHQKKVKMSPNKEETYPFPFGWWFEQQILFSNQVIQFQSFVN